MSGLVFLIEESDEEAAIKPETKEEQELGIVHSWMEMRELACTARGGGLGVVVEGRFSLLAWYLHGFLFQLFFLYFPPYISISYYSWSISLSQNMLDC